MLAATCGVVVAVAAGVTAFALTRSGSTPTGAATPEQAVTRAITAVAAQDADGVLAVVDPAESRTLRALYGAVRGKAAKDGLLAASGIPAPWLHLSATGLTAHVVDQHASIAFVQLDGTASAQVDQAGLPTQVRPSTPAVGTAHGTVNSLAEHLRQPAEVAVVKVGGRWWLSPTTTLLESIRKAAGLPTPNFDQVTPLDGGADTPGGVVTGLAQALSARDEQAAAGYLSQQEIPALAAYYPLFASQGATELQQVDGRTGAITTSVQPMSNGLAKVQIESAAVNSQAGAVTYSGGCVSATGGERPACVKDWFTALTGWSRPFVVVGKESGKWRIQPVATVLEYLRVLVAEGSMNAVYRWVNAPELAPVTATVRIGGSQQVKLNDAAFAHIELKAAPGTCFTSSTDTGWVSWSETDSFDGGTANSGSGGSGTPPSCTDEQVPDSGVMYGLVLAGVDQRPTTVKLDIERQ